MYFFFFFFFLNRAKNGPYHHAQIPKAMRWETEANSRRWEFQGLQCLIVPLPEVTSRPNNGQKASIGRGQEQIREVGFGERSFSDVSKLRTETKAQRREE